MSNDSELVWMKLPLEYRSAEKSSFVVLPVSYEKDVTYGKGTSNGSSSIVSASSHLEYYDEEFDCEYFEKGVYVHPSLDLSSGSAEDMVSKVQGEVVSCGVEKFVLGLGGDHAVTIGLVRGLEEIEKQNGNEGDFAILQIDAHSDFRDSWNGSVLNHACVMKQLSGRHEIVYVGIRSQDKDERVLVDECESVQTVYAWEYSISKVKESLLNLKAKRMYITIDVDGFDPSVISCTGTPEPGGLFWKQVIEILKLCFSMKEIIGADIVEFLPIYESNGEESNQSRVEAYTLARLVSKIFSLAVKK